MTEITQEQFIDMMCMAEGLLQKFRSSDKPRCREDEFKGTCEFHDEKDYLKFTDGTFTPLDLDQAEFFQNENENFVEYRWHYDSDRHGAWRALRYYII